MALAFKAVVIAMAVASIALTALNVASIEAHVRIWSLSISTYDSNGGDKWLRTIYINAFLLR